MNQTAASPSCAHIDLGSACVPLVCALHGLTSPFLVTVLTLAGAGVLLGGIAANLVTILFTSVRNEADCVGSP